jgi:methionyl-tRNA formyltransferase
MNVVLAGEESAGLQLLGALAKSEHRLVAVLAEPPKPSATTVSVWKAARQLGVPTWPASAVTTPELGERLRSEGADILLNVHSLHRIHQDVLKAPKLGAFNLHPGPLPRYAGLNSVSWALFRGEQTHGVTVHRMDAGIDTGPIAFQALFPIRAEDTALSLSLTCVREGIPLILRLLEVAAANPAQIPLQPQSLAKREYFGRGVPQQGWVSWFWPARKVVDFVRACDFFPFHSPWGHPRTRLGMQEFSIAKARQTGLTSDAPPGTVGKAGDSGAEVASQDQWVLVSKLLLAGKVLSAQEILKPGDRLAEAGL